MHCAIRNLAAWRAVLLLGSARAWFKLLHITSSVVWQLKGTVPGLDFRGLKQIADHASGKLAPAAPADAKPLIRLVSITADQARARAVVANAPTAVQLHCPNRQHKSETIICFWGY